LNEFSFNTMLGVEKLLFGVGGGLGVGSGSGVGVGSGSGSGVGGNIFNFA
jgi:hypothetical protein